MFQLRCSGVLGQMMKSFACTFFHCFTFPFCVYAGTLPAGGFVLVHRIHNTTDSGTPPMFTRIRHCVQFSFPVFLLRGHNTETHGIKQATLVSSGYYYVVVFVLSVIGGSLPSLLLLLSSLFFPFIFFIIMLLLLLLLLLLSSFFASLVNFHGISIHPTHRQLPGNSHNTLL